MQLSPVLGKEGPLPALALNWSCAGIFPRYHLSSLALVTKCPLFLKVCSFAWIFGSSDFFKMQLCCLQVSGWNSNQLLAIGPLSPFWLSQPVFIPSWHVRNLDFLPHHLGDANKCRKTMRSNSFPFIDFSLLIFIRKEVIP